MLSMCLQAAIALGIISLVLALVVLLFLGNILLDVVDATYFCYAMDLDAQAVTRADIHDVISKVSLVATEEAVHAGERYSCLQGKDWVAAHERPSAS